MDDTCKSAMNYKQTTIKLLLVQSNINCIKRQNLYSDRFYLAKDSSQKLRNQVLVKIRGRYLHGKIIQNKVGSQLKNRNVIISCIIICLILRPVCHNTLLSFGLLFFLLRFGQSKEFCFYLPTTHDKYWTQQLYLPAIL